MDHQPFGFSHLLNLTLCSELLSNILVFRCREKHVGGFEPPGLEMYETIFNSSAKTAGGLHLPRSLRCFLVFRLVALLCHLCPQFDLLRSLLGYDFLTVHVPHSVSCPGTSRQSTEIVCQT